MTTPAAGQQLSPDLISAMASLSAMPVHADFPIFIDALKERFGTALDAILLYGSCLRAQQIADGVADFYVIVDSYSHAYQQQRLRLFNKWLPPNVFYLEVTRTENGQTNTFRAKYAVLSMADFEQGNRDWFHSYLWARFAQPVRLLYARGETERCRIHVSLAQAVLKFLQSTIPVSGTCITDVETLWTRGLSLTYAAELRPERETRARLLAQLNLDDFTRLTWLALPAMEGRLALLAENQYQCHYSDREKRRASWHWQLRRWQGRVLSVLRLTKALFTFNNALDYAAWKIERHTGVHVEITPALRRHPVLWGCKVFGELVRRGVVR